MFITYIIFSFVAGIIIASILYWTLRKKNGYRDPDKEIFFLKQSIDDLKKIFQEQKNEESKKIGVFEELTRNIQKSVDLINSDTIGLKNALVGGNRYQGKMGEMGLEILFSGTDPHSYLHSGSFLYWIFPSLILLVLLAFIGNSEDDDDGGGGMLQPVYRQIDT